MIREQSVKLGHGLRRAVGPENFALNRIPKEPIALWVIFPNPDSAHTPRQARLVIGFPVKLTLGGDPENALKDQPQNQESEQVACKQDPSVGRQDRKALGDFDTEEERRNHNDGRENRQH